MIGVAIGAGGGYLIGRRKHHPLLGAILGAFAPVLGLVIIALVGPNNRADAFADGHAAVATAPLHPAR